MAAHSHSAVQFKDPFEAEIYKLYKAVSTGAKTNPNANPNAPLSNIS